MHVVVAASPAESRGGGRDRGGGGQSARPGLTRLSAGAAVATPSPRTEPHTRSHRFPPPFLPPPPTLPPRHTRTAAIERAEEGLRREGGKGGRQGCEVRRERAQLMTMACDRAQASAHPHHRQSAKEKEKRTGASAGTPSHLRRRAQESARWRRGRRSSSAGPGRRQRWVRGMVDAVSSCAQGGRAKGEGVREERANARGGSALPTAPLPFRSR